MKKNRAKTKAELERELVSLRRKLKALEGRAQPAADAGGTTPAEESKPEAYEPLAQLIRYKFIASASQDFMTLINRAYVYEAANDAFCRAWGRREDEVIGSRVPNLWGEEVFKKTIKPPLDRCFKGMQVRYEDSFSFPAFGLRQYEVTYSPFRTEKGIITHAAVITHDITDRKLAEENLRTERALLGRITDNMRDIIALADPEMILQYVTPSVQNILGYKPDGITGTPAFELIHPEDSDRVKRVVAALIETRNPGKAEFRYRHANGHYIWFETTGNLVTGEKGTVEGIVLVCRDVTERVRAEKALRESEGKFRSLAERSPNMIFINKRGRIVYANMKCEELMGYRREDFYSPQFDFLNLIAPESRDLVKQNFMKHLANEELPPYEYTLITADGKPIEAIHTTKVINYEGEVAILGIVTDITERRRAEAALHETNETLEALIQSSPLAITMLDPEGRVQIWNRAAEQIFGWKAEEVLGQPNPIVPPQKQSEYDEMRSRVVRGESLAGVEVHRTRKDGAIIDVSLSTSLLKDAQGDARGIMAVIADISGRKAMEQRLRLSDEILQRVGSLVLVSNSNGEIVYASPSVKTVLGYMPEELLGDKWWQISRKNERSAAQERERVARSARGELRISDSTYETFVQHRDGGMRCILWNDSAGPEGMLIGVGQDITDLKHAEEAIEQSERRFKTLIEKSSDVLLILDVSGATRYVSPSVKTVLGFDAEERLGRSAFELVHPDDRAEVEAVLKDLMQTSGKSTSVHFRARHKDGSWRWLEATGTNHLSDPTVAGVVINYRDITERKRSEEELIRLRKAVVSSGEVIFMTDREGTFTFVNPTFTSVYGFTAGEVVGKTTPRILKSGSMRKENYADFWNTILNKNLAIGELTNKTKDGRLLTIHSSVNPILDDQGKIVGFLAIQRDVTEQKKVEEKNREQAALLDIAQDAIIVRTMNDRIVYWNKGAQRLYGWTAEEALGKDANRLLFKDLPAELSEADEVVLNRGEWSGELTQIRKDRTEVIVESRWTLVRDNKGLPLSKLSVNTDISGRKKLEKQFLRAQRMESVGTLAGGIAHDLNNVLAPVLISLQILRKKLPQPEDRSMLDRLESTVQRGADLVKQVLTFSRGMEIDRSLLQVRHIIEEIKRFVKETFPAGIEITTNTPPELWPISGDATQLHQILLNLCVNARDAMPNGGTLSIEASNLIVDENFTRIDAEAKLGPHIVIAVSDTGMGIPDDVRDKIFEPFFTTKEVGKGTGLGLSTVYAIVKGHNGFIHVYSEVDRGTTFKVYLPAIPSEQVERPLEEAVESYRGSGELVLLVDDETAICEITRLTLESNGYRVVTSADGADALTQYFSHRPSIKLVITDISMPIMDGPALIRALRRLDPTLNIIAATGLGDRMKVAEVQKSNVQAFLSKPFTAEKLLETVHGVLTAVTDGPSSDHQRPS
jgi:PAS domain S-box-containing protein